MNRAVKYVFALVFSTALLLATSVMAFADVVLESEGSGYQLKIEAAGEYTPTDLFDEFKNVIPGDERTQAVTVRNDSGLPVYVYLRAEEHGVENDLTYDDAREKADGKDQANVDGERDETIDSANSFLSLLNLRVKNGEKVIFDTSPDREASLAESVYLGMLSEGQSIVLDLTLSVPLEVDGAALGNEYANRVGEVDWVFTVVEYDPYVPPTDPEDPDDPLLPIEPDEPQPDDPKPEGPLGQTGDSSPLALLAGVSLLAALLVVVAAIARRISARR